MQSIILFVAWAGRYKLKIVFRNGQNRAKKCKMCYTYGSSVRNHGNTCRVIEEFVLDFKTKFFGC